MTTFTQEDQNKILAAIVRLIYSKDVRTQEDEELIKIIESRALENNGE